MVTEQDVFSMEITPADMQIIRPMAALQRKVGQGGSQFRPLSDRIANHHQDSEIGMIGTYAGLKYLTGSPHQFYQARWFQNLMPYTGDGGSDVPGANIDFKARCWRHESLGLFDHKFAVRPKERHPNWIYIHLVIKPLIDDYTTVYFVGWLRDGMLPAKPEQRQESVFRGAFVLAARRLNPLPPITWAWC